MSIISTLLYKSSEKKKFNILDFPTHERYQTGLAKTGHEFYLVHGQGIKQWNHVFAPLPKNIHLLNSNLGQSQLWPEVDYDFVLSQNKFAHFQVASELSRSLHLPLISLEHCLPQPGLRLQELQYLKGMSGNINVFISEFNRKAWGYTESEGEVIYHGVDTELFKPDPTIERQPFILSVVNDWINRDWCMIAGQQILTSIGYVPIEKIRPGMLVLTDDGTYHPVVKTMQREYNGPMIFIKIGQSKELAFTHEHDIRVHRNGQWKYIGASRIGKDDILRFPPIEQTDWSIGQDLDFCWLVGLIIGDGSITNKGNISICLNEKETDIADRAKNILGKYVGHSYISERARNNKKKPKKAITVEGSGKIFANWLKHQIGEKSYSKYIPDFIFNGSKLNRIACMAGLFAADGHIRSNNDEKDRVILATISKRLASQYSTILNECGVRNHIRLNKRNQKGVAGHKLFVYHIIVSGITETNKFKELITNYKYEEPYNRTVTSVRMEEEWTGTVYNCSVDKNPSYVVYPGIVAHNCCGHTLWEQSTKDLPTKVLGDTPGLSKAAENVFELAKAYQSNQIFLNTSLISPVPSVLIESMSSGMACVSTNNCSIPEFITHGGNGLLANSPEELRQHCQLLLKDHALREKLGNAARKTIVEKFGMDKFVQSWQKVFERAANIIYKG